VLQQKAANFVPACAASPNYHSSNPIIEAAVFPETSGLFYQSKGRHIVEHAKCDVGQIVFSLNSTLFFQYKMQ
jgi:hypothetical protein